MLDSETAAVELTRVGGSARGFLGLDPVTQNEALLARELTRAGASVFRADDGLVGCAPNPESPRQSYVATTSADPGAVRAVLEHLVTYQRCASFVALVPAGSPAGAAFVECGFAPVGVLREHRFHSGAYHDVHVYFAGAEEPCPS